jgi:hypothetical protein
MRSRDRSSRFQPFSPMSTRKPCTLFHFKSVAGQLFHSNSNITDIPQGSNTQHAFKNPGCMTKHVDRLQTSLTVSSKPLCIKASLLPQTRTRRPNWCSERAKGLGRRFGVGQRAGGSTKVSSFPPSAALEHLPRSTHFDLLCLLHFDYCALIGRGKPTKGALS